MFGLKWWEWLALDAVANGPSHALGLVWRSFKLILLALLILWIIGAIHERFFETREETASHLAATKSVLNYFYEYDRCYNDIDCDINRFVRQHPKDRM